MNLKRSLALALSALMLLTMPIAFGADGVLPRISGSDRYATAVAVSQEGWESAVTVVLARGDHFADALAGVPLAYKLDAPILLTAKDSLPAVTKNEIARLNATKVIILGGTGAVSKAVADEIAGTGILVTRIAGDDRYETAALIADEIVEEGKVGTVVLANGLNFADALAAAPYAAANGFPILLTNPTALPEATEDKINELAPSKMIIVGGTSAISSDVMTAVSTRNPVRVFGKDRFATAIALANHFAPQTTMMYVASGLDFPDAITGAALAAKKGTGLLLVGNTLSDDVKNFINEFGIFDATIFGGLKAVNSDVENAIYAALIGATETGVAGWTTSGATVTVGKKSTTASTSGFYKITGIAPGTYSATYKLTGMKTETQKVVVVKDEISVNNPLLEGLNQSDIEIHIAAVKANGAPVPNAEVWFSPWIKSLKKYDLPYLAGTTNENGVLVITNEGETPLYNFGDKLKVDVGIDPIVDSTANTITGAYHWVTREVTLATDLEINELDGYVLTPVKPMTISGKVTGFWGEPQGKDEKVKFIYAYDIDEDELRATASSIEATIDKDGNYQFPNLTLPSDKYVMYYAHSNTETAIHAVPVTVSEGTNLTHNIQLVKGYNLSFKLDTEEAGERFIADPIFAGIYDGDLLVTELDYALMEGGEYFTITGERFAPGNFTLKVFGDYVIAKSFSIGITQAAANEGTVYLAGRTYRAGVITGKVFDSVGAAVNGATVELIDANGKVVDLQSTGSGNEYRFGGLPHGAKYTVRASRTGYLTATRPTAELDTGAVAVTVVANTDQEQNINLKAVPTNANVAGYVRTAGSYLPAVGAKVYFHALSVVKDATGKLYPINEILGTATVAADGSYKCEGLLPGTYRVVIRDPGKHEYNISTLSVAAGDDLEAQNYFLTKGGDATFTVTVKAGDDILTTGVHLFDAFGVEITGGTAVDIDENISGDDAVQFINLSGGIYEVYAECAGYKDHSQDFAVGKSAEVEKVVNMIKADDLFSVNFAVFGKQNAELGEGVKILVYSGPYVVYNSAAPVTGVGENSRLAKLPKGTYTAEFWAQDYLFVTKTFNVIDKDMYVKVLQLEAWQ